MVYIYNVPQFIDVESLNLQFQSVVVLESFTFFKFRYCILILQLYIVIEGFVVVTLRLGLQPR